jgi:hypothetical protein
VSEDDVVFKILCLVAGFVCTAYVWPQLKSCYYNYSAVPAPKPKVAGTPGKVEAVVNKGDAAVPNQLNFQTPATAIMEKIVDLHHDLMFFIIVIVVFVS